VRPVRRPVLVESALSGFVGESHLYRVGERDYFVFCCAPGSAWDVAEADEQRRFGNTVVRGAASLEDAVRELGTLEA
jgi:hypothetical protein